jgi:hypothetical protein
MKVYIGTREIEDKNFKCLKDVTLLQAIADDSECTNIILDGVLRKYTLSEIANVLNLVLSKLRLGGELIISDLDFDLVVFAHKKLGNLPELNKMVESIGGFKSFLTYELVSDIVKTNPRTSLISVDINNIEFKLVFKRA